MKAVVARFEVGERRPRHLPPGDFAASSLRVRWADIDEERLLETEVGEERPFVEPAREAGAAQQ